MKKAVIIIALIIVGAILYQKGVAIIGGKMMQKMMAKPPIVDLVKVEEGEIIDFVESPGRLEPKYSVNVVARINGWLQKRYFEEGAFVRKGQALFLIEPNEYANAVSQARASMRQAQASLVNSEKELKRAAQLVKEDFVSKSYYDNAVAKRDADRAALDVARASLSQANLNYSYTRVVSPIDGKIGSINITEGNLVNPQTGTLATIVSTDPIYAYFNMKSESILRFKRNNAMISNEDAIGNMNVTIKLADGHTYPVKGKVEFTDNTVDQTVGALRLRATFPNKDNLLVPGDYLNVVAKSAAPRKVLFVPQVAVYDSPDGFYVYVVDKDGKAQKQPVKLDLQEEDNWVVLDGLKAGDEVIARGLQKLKPGIKVEIGKHFDIKSLQEQLSADTKALKDKENQTDEEN